MLRIFNTCSPHMDVDDGCVVGNSVVQVLRGDHITPYGDGSQTSPFCHFDDSFEGLLATIESPAGLTGALNVGNPAESSKSELAERVRFLSGSHSQIVHCALPADEPSLRRPDLDIDCSRMGWQAEVVIDDGLRETIPYSHAPLSS